MSITEGGDVPSIFHSSVPFALFVAVKNSLSPATVRLAGNELPEPDTMSITEGRDVPLNLPQFRPVGCIGCREIECAIDICEVRQARLGRATLWVEVLNENGSTRSSVACPEFTAVVDREVEPVADNGQIGRRQTA